MAALDIRIAGRYKLGRKIGSGSFGDIYLGEAVSQSRTGWIARFKLALVLLDWQPSSLAGLQGRTYRPGRKLVSNWYLS